MKTNNQFTGRQNRVPSQRWSDSSSPEPNSSPEPRGTSPPSPPSSPEPTQQSGPSYSPDTPEYNPSSTATSDVPRPNILELGDEDLHILARIIHRPDVMRELQRIRGAIRRISRKEGQRAVGASLRFFLQKENSNNTDN